MAASQQLLDRYQGRLTTLRQRTSAGLLLAWDGLGSYREGDAERFASETAPLLAGVKIATVATSAAFFALAMGTRPVGVPAEAVADPARIVHPFLATWHALRMDRPLEEAVAAGRSQADAVGFDFVQSVARRTGDHVARASGQRVRWRRSPGATACSWCRTVAGQTYRTAESADFGHDRCDCIAVPA